MCEKKGKNYFDYAVNVNRWSMRILGLWPSEDNLFSNCLFWLAIVITIQSAVPVLLYISTTKTYFKDLDAIILLMTMITCTIRLVIMKIKKKDLKIIIDEMSLDWKDTSMRNKKTQEISISNALYGRKVNLFFISILCIAAFVYMVSPIYLQWKQRTNETMHMLIFKSQYPIDFKTSPTYELLFLSQIIYSAYLCTTIFASDSFLVVILFHLCSQLEVIANNMKYLEHRNINSHLQMIGFRNCNCFKCIMGHHVQLRRNLKIIQDSFNVIMLMQVTSNAIILCVQGYTIVKAMSDGNLFGAISYILYIFFSTFNVFIYCNLGERVIQKSLSIGREVYEMPWYDMDPKFRQLFIIIIMRSNKPFELKAGHVFTMSLVTYKSIIVTAFSYASCLLALSEK